MINKQSPLPIYFQLEEQIKKQIEEGQFLPHAILPSEREYAEKYEISRMTVRQAINNLVHSGYLYRQKGKGTFVAEKKFEQQLNGLTSFTEDMKARGLTPGNKLVSFEIIPASRKTADELRISLHAPVYEIKRIRLADQMPMALETVYISANLVKGLTEQIIVQSLYQYVESLGFRIDHAVQTLESVMASESETEYLEIPNPSPILFVQRKTFLGDGTPLEYVKSAYRADRYKFTIEINR